MRIAVLTLTRDRLAYTQHCFQTLQENAGCDYDHFVLDQASTDGTVDWLNEQDDLDVIFASENLGICPALNLLLEESCDPREYDVIVRFDNDCEVLQPDTLRVVSELAAKHHSVLSPRVLGLNNPPRIINAGMRFGDLDGRVYRIDETEILGGIFMAVPAMFFTEIGFRYDDSNPVWGGDEAICAWWRAQGGRCGYVPDFTVNHYLTTSGQHADIPAYFERTLAEGKPSL